MSDGVTSLAGEIFKDENLRCPHALWAQFRDHCPVPCVELPNGTPGYLVTRKSDLEYVATHPEIFGSEVDPSVWRWGNSLGPEFAPIFAGQGYQPVHTVVTADPPAAHLYRKIALEALSSKRVKARAASLAAIVDGLIERLPIGSAFDFKTAFAVPLPILAMLDIYGLPASDADFVFDLSNAAMRLFDITTPIEIALDSARSLVAFQQYIEPFIHACRAAPTDRFLSALATATTPAGALLSMPEVMSIAFITLAGGNDTTRNAIAAAALALATDPAIAQALRDDETRIEAFADEVVRHSSPSLVTPRQARIDTELAGTRIPAGAPVYMLWGSGSRDETAFANADEIRLDRRLAGRMHTSFGYGTHHCAGMYLARLELVLAVKALLRSFSSIALAIPECELEYEPIWVIRSLAALPLILRV